MTNPADVLFRPGSLGRLTAPNRLIMPPMVLNYCDPQGRVTDRYRAHMARVAAGGVGTMILEASYVAHDGKGFANQLGLHTDEHVEGLRGVVEDAHRHGALIGPQLYHAGRQTNSRVTGLPLIAPSAVPCPLMQEVPEAMTREDIARVVEQFAQAARRARLAGCDFVEIHGAHGYLLMQFLSPYSNQRNDEYGGGIENRLRFPLEVVRAVRHAVGPEFTVLYRISAEEGVPGGLTLDDAIRAARALAEAGIDALHVSVGNYGSYVQGRMIPPMSMPDGVNVKLAAAISAKVDIPVIAVGKCRSPETAASIIENGEADFVALGRSLLADPDWPRKAREGRAHEINPCIACNQGCISRLFEQQDVWCTVNPETGRERAFTTRVKGAPPRIAVVGGGPGGMAAAITAKRIGANVTLFEEDDCLGGQLQAAAAAPHREDWRLFGAWLEDEIARRGIEVRLNCAVTPELLEDETPDLVVVATGARPVRAELAHPEGVPVLHARDVLEGRASASGRVAVIGGGCSGIQTAEYLAVRGHAVSVIEAAGQVATEMPIDDRHLMLARLHALGVEIRTEQRLLRVTDQGAQVRGPQGDEIVPADTVLLCLGAQPDDALVDALMNRGWQVATIGDARRPRRVTDAVAEGALAVLYFVKERSGGALRTA